MPLEIVAAMHNGLRTTREYAGLLPDSEEVSATTKSTSPVGVAGATRQDEEAVNAASRAAAIQVLPKAENGDSRSQTAEEPSIRTS